MEFYSPIQQIKFKDLVIDVKRDDLIDPIISGNKWRKLKWILKDAINSKKTHLVTFGGAFSNHLIAAAAIAAKYRLKSTAFVRGHRVENHMLLICRLFGMELIFIDREAYKNKLAVFETYFSGNNQACFIDQGGVCEQAVKGCAEIIQELPVEFDHIVCAAGTGATAAGLLRGVAQQNLKTKIHVIPVLKPNHFIYDVIASYQKNTDRLWVHQNFHGGGYAKTNDELLYFIKDFAKETGLLLDPVYTGKAMLGLIKLVYENVISKNHRILFLHTGGIWGLPGKQAEFYKLL